MSEYTSYYLYQKYQKIGDGDWTPVSPSVFSVNGDGTMPLSAKTENDPNCGYVPEAIYRWVNMDISTNWVCDDCPIPQYRTVSTAYTCVGYDKHYLNEYQVSYNSGATWITTATTTGELIETNSTYCGYMPPIGSTKLYMLYSNADPYYVLCDLTRTITTANTRPAGYEYSAMTSALIGDCVDSIGDTAFGGCESLTGITIPNSVTSIGSSSFNFCNSFTSIDIPNSVTSIGNAAFASCHNLTSVTIGNGLTSISDAAFMLCYSLASINIPNSVTSIGTYAFYEDSGLTSINIPDSVTSIGQGAFQYCSGLTSVTIGSGITSIGSVAFEHCSGLTSITVNATTPPTLPGNNPQVFIDTNNCPIYVPCESVNLYKATTNWSIYADRIQGIPPCEPDNTKFRATYTGGTTYSAECDSNTTISSASTNPSYRTSMATAVVGNCVTTISSSTFYGCNKLSSCTISNNVTSIGEHAFRNCSSLTGITIPTGITAISAHTFNGCTILSNVDIPSGVTVIGTGAFEYCSASTFTSVTIPDSTTEIGTAAFLYCRNLVSVNIGSGVTKIGRNAFAGCVNLTSVIITATTPPTLTDTGAFNDSTCPIYVPSSSVGAYKASWTEYASRITAIPNS